MDSFRQHLALSMLSSIIMILGHVSKAYFRWAWCVPHVHIMCSVLCLALHAQGEARRYVVSVLHANTWQKVAKQAPLQTAFALMHQYFPGIANRIHWLQPA